MRKIVTDVSGWQVCRDVARQGSVGGGLMLDGIHLSRDQTAVVALGIGSNGNSRVLDFVLGSKENSEVSQELMGRIVKRWFRCEQRLYVVLDGSDALWVTVREFFPDAIVRRCLVHKERIKGELSNRHWGDLSRFFTHLRSVQGLVATKEVFGELPAFLKRINKGAYLSLQEMNCSRYTDWMFPTRSIKLREVPMRSRINFFTSVANWGE